MLKKHSQYFKEIIIDRTEEIGREILCNNQRYRELNTEICEVQQALTDNLAPQMQSLVNRYDDVESEQEGLPHIHAEYNGEHIVVDNVDYSQKTGYNISKEKSFDSSMLGVIGDGPCGAVFRFSDPLRS
jgi:hypothetical protein